jgi:hypothetical protein
MNLLLRVSASTELDKQHLIRLLSSGSEVITHIPRCCSAIKTNKFTFSSMSDKSSLIYLEHLTKITFYLIIS